MSVFRLRRSDPRMPALGALADITTHPWHVRFPLIADIQGMSWHVRFVPQADIGGGALAIGLVTVGPLWRASLWGLWTSNRVEFQPNVIIE